MYYLCHTKEERALDTRVLSSFLAKKLTYKGCFTSDVEKNTSEIDFFLGGIVRFLRQVVASVADVEPQKVKRYLFSQGADLTFRGTGQVGEVRSEPPAVMPCGARGLQGVTFQGERAASLPFHATNGG